MTESIEQASFGAFDPAEFAENPEQRCPCVLLLDTSGSMRGAPIEELNAGLRSLQEELLADRLACKRVELAVVSFGPIQLETDFVTADKFTAPTLVASGNTPMGQAILYAIDIVKRRKEMIRQNLGPTMCLRPWIWLMTDGSPTDDWAPAAVAVHDGDSTEKKAFSFFAVGVRGADMEVLSRISVRPPLLLDGVRFRDMFVWLSASLSGIARSQPGTKTLLMPPGWTSVSS